MPPLKKYIPYHPDEVNLEWVSEMLLKHGTTCEFHEPCDSQAEYPYLGARIVAYLCGAHMLLVEENPLLWAPLEGSFKEKFNSMFNFFKVANDGFGAVYDQIEANQAAGKVLRREAQATIRKVTKEEQRAANAAYRELRRDVKPGAPDEELARRRGAQPPPRASQPLIRRPSILPLTDDRGLLILGKIPGEGT